MIINIISMYILGASCIALVSGTLMKQWGKLSMPVIVIFSLIIGLVGAFVLMMIFFSLFGPHWGNIDA